MVKNYSIKRDSGKLLKGHLIWLVNIDENKMYQYDYVVFHDVFNSRKRMGSKFFSLKEIEELITEGVIEPYTGAVGSGSI